MSGAAKAQHACGWDKGPPQLRKGISADPTDKGRTYGALEANRTMKKPERSPTPQSQVAYDVSALLLSSLHEGGVWSIGFSMISKRH
jgi:hypothetical protein